MTGELNDELTVAYAQQRSVYSRRCSCVPKIVKETL